MNRYAFLLGLLVIGLSSSAFANFPSRITVQFKNKMSCRDARKLLKPSHLYVNCQLNAMRSSEYSADYLGLLPLHQVISQLAANSKVQGIASGEELQEAMTEASN